jgi:hypothetical protein
VEMTAATSGGPSWWLLGPIVALIVLVYYVLPRALISFAKRRAGGRASDRPPWFGSRAYRLAFVSVASVGIAVVRLFTEDDFGVFICAAVVALGVAHYCGRLAFYVATRRRG